MSGCGLHRHVPECANVHHTPSNPTYGHTRACSYMEKVPHTRKTLNPTDVNKQQRIGSVSQGVRTCMLMLTVLSHWLPSGHVMVTTWRCITVLEPPNFNTCLLPLHALMKRRTIAVGHQQPCSREAIGGGLPDVASLRPLSPDPSPRPSISETIPGETKTSVTNTNRD